MAIEHLIIPAGGPNFFIYYGIIRQLYKKKIIINKNLKTINATSCGSIIALLFLLHPNIKHLDNYLINRPWENAFNLNIDKILSYFDDNGLFDFNDIMEIFIPFFNLTNLDKYVTLKELYKITNIEFNIYTTNFTLLKLEVINYKNNPDLSVVKAIHMSSALPLLISPVYYNNNIYIDGALFSSNPINNAIKDIIDLNLDTVLAFKLINKENDLVIKNIFNYIITLLYKISCIIDIDSRYNNNPIPNINNLIHVDYLNISDNAIWYNILYKKSYRKKYIKKGINIGKQFIKQYSQTDLSCLP